MRDQNGQVQSQSAVQPNFRIGHVRLEYERDGNFAGGPRPSRGLSLRKVRFPLGDARSSHFLCSRIRRRQWSPTPSEVVSARNFSARRCHGIIRIGGRTTWKARPPRLQRPLRHVRSCLRTWCWAHRFSASASVDEMHFRWWFWRHFLLHLREPIQKVASMENLFNYVVISFIDLSINVSSIIFIGPIWLHCWVFDKDELWGPTNSTHQLSTTPGPIFANVPFAHRPQKRREKEKQQRRGCRHSRIINTGTYTVPVCDDAAHILLCMLLAIYGNLNRKYFAMLTFSKFKRSNLPEPREQTGI